MTAPEPSGGRAPLEAPSRAPILKPKWKWCRMRGCRNSGPFASLAAWESHRRRDHGVGRITFRKRRPEGGAFACKYASDDPPCDARPYMTAGGRARHYATSHGEVTENPQSIARRQRRAESRRKLELPAWMQVLLKDEQRDPPPASPATFTHRGKKDELAPKDRVRALALLDAALGAWAIEMRATRYDLRSEVGAELATNFGRHEPREVRALRTSALNPGQRDRLRRRLLYVVNGEWARAVDATPAALRDGLLGALNGLGR